jgi:hypothetical protein
METADWHTAQSGSGRPTIVLLSVFVNDWDEPAADPRTLNRREVHSSPIHDGVACCCRGDSSFWAVSEYKGRGERRKIEHSYDQLEV